MIIELEDTLISSEIFTSHFTCHLEKCKGACCIEGDRGAPLETEEIGMIEKNIDVIRNYMTPDGIKLLDSEGFHEGEEIDDPVTNCLPGGECIFAYKENGILGCSIEKAYQSGKINFYKPLSCHLYPIRIGRAGEAETVNYHRWDICQAACTLGSELNMPLFQFVKIPLIRKFGKEWYRELEFVYAEYLKQYPVL